MSNSTFVKGFQNMWHALVHDTKKEVYDDLNPLIDFILKNGGPIIITVATGLLTGAPPTAPWNALIDQFIPLAEAAGVKLAQGEAAIILNLAKAKLGLPNAA